MKIAVVFLALFAVALAIPARQDSERRLNLQPLDPETAKLLQSLMNDPEAVAFLQNNPELQALFKQALGAEDDLFRDTAEKERCLILLSYLLVLSQISVTTTSG